MTFLKLFINKLIRVRNMSLVVIIGLTGSGKSKLALDIANKFNGEIISADSMQVYKGLDIVTNKVSLEDRQRVRHHLIDFLDPLKRFTVVDFRNMALNAIEDVTSRGMLPIIVGGTNYYIESILWEVLIEDHINDERNDVLLCDRENLLSHTFSANYSDSITKENIFLRPINSENLKDISSERLYNILNEIDPKSAENLHWNNKRKIIRCLQAYQQSGKLYSELIEEQHSLDGGSYLGGPLRYKNALILWVQCDQKILNDRLDKRVDEMIERGLIRELLKFHLNYNEQRLQHNLVPDYTNGIFQSIGFKEFHKYLILNEDKRKSLEANQLLNKGIEEMKFVTKKYAKSQLKWIRNRFIKLNEREVPNIYNLNGTDLDKWTVNVSEPAFEIVEAYFNKTLLSSNLSPVPKIELPLNNSKIFKCDVCNKTICGNIAFEQHNKSKSHKWQLKQNDHKLKLGYHQLIYLLECQKNHLQK